MMDNTTCQTQHLDYISVCICSYKRPEMLGRALNGIISQRTERSFSFELIIVDNDWKRSAEAVVKSFQEKSDNKIVYDCEPIQNISLARNRCVQNASGNLIAFIDDDEFPENMWLLNLYKTLQYSKADGVLGPVIPFTERNLPKWIKKGRLLERPVFITGTVLKSQDMRTGNVLFFKRIIDEKSMIFDPALGRMGGEDGDFFRRMTKKGHIFVWCNEACVYESIPAERFKRMYFVKRALLRGVSEAHLHKKVDKDVLKSLLACSIYTCSLPLLFILGHHLFMKYLIKDCDHLGKLLALCGFEVIKERTF